MNLANSSIRTFTLLDPKNTLIFSTVALSNELQSQISAVPCTIASLGASFELNIETWRTDDRTCVFLRFPMTAEQPGQGFQTFPVFSFATAESTMSFEELRQRTIIYFRVCQSMLQPTEFRPPWSFHMQILSIQPTYLLSVLCTAERLINSNPALLCHNLLQYPSICLKQLESGQQSPCKLLKRCINQITESDDETPVSQIQEILLSMQAMVFIDDQLVGCFAANSYDSQSNTVQATKIDALDGIVLAVLQADTQFMTGQKFQYELCQSAKESILSRAKQVISDEAVDDCAVETRPNEELDGQRILQLRINNKLTSVVCIFRQIELSIEMPQGYPQPRCRICYLHPLTNALHQILKTKCENKLIQLIHTCRTYVCQHMAPFERFVSDEMYIHVLNAHNPERSFSLRYQISSFPGLLYCNIKNLSRGTVLAPNLEVDQADIEAISKIENVKYEQGSDQADTASNDSYKSPFVKVKQQQNKPFTEPEDFVLTETAGLSPVLNIRDDMNSQQLIKLIQKQYQIVRQQVRKLLQMEHQALNVGINYTIERDGQFCRIMWLFYNNVTPNTEAKSNSNQVQTKTESTLNSGLWPQDANIFQLPISRQQLIQLNQTEEIVKGRRTEYSEQGGYMCTPQYWASVDKLSRESKQFKKIAQQNASATYELFELQAVFLNLVSFEDIREMTGQLFKKFASLVWGDYYQQK